jgi:hypothetical protein
MWDFNGRPVRIDRLREEIEKLEAKRAAGTLGTEEALDLSGFYGQLHNTERKLLEESPWKTATA